MDYEFDRIDLICVGISTVFGIWYLVKKVCVTIIDLSEIQSCLIRFIWFQHWIANNVLGLAFAVNGVELLQLNRYVI
jgi:minor histocompatibility antigen H13